VKAILSGKLPRKLLDGFLPSGFTTDYKIQGDSIKFVCYSDEFGAEEFPKPYRYNYFTFLHSEGLLFIHGYTAIGTIRELKVVLEKTEIRKN